MVFPFLVKEIGCATFGISSCAIFLPSNEAVISTSVISTSPDPMVITVFKWEKESISEILSPAIATGEMVGIPSRR